MRGREKRGVWSHEREREERGVVTWEGERRERTHESSNSYAATYHTDEIDKESEK